MTQVENYSPRRARRSAGPEEELVGEGPAAESSLESTGHQAAGRRGSHATTYGQGFSWVMIWTIIGAFIPGTGLLAAGRRQIGAILLILLGLMLAGLAVAGLTGDVLHRALNVALNTKKLLIIAVAAVILGLIWAAVILFTHLQLRHQANLSSGQRLFSAVVVAALLVGVALPAYKVSSYAMIQRDLVKSITHGNDSDGTTTSLNQTKADPWASVPRINVLLIGSDAGSDRVGTRPDTMIVASIDTKSGNTVLFSLPRNLEHAPFPPGTGGAKAFPDGFFCPQDACLLNAVWQWGETSGKQYYSKYKQPGLKATEDALEGVTGLKIDQYASLNLQGFSDFVKAIGGITVNVNERLPIGGNSEHGCGQNGWIEPGNHQHLDGYHALWFARSRCSTTDFDRMRRQRCVIGAIVKKSNPSVLVKQFPAIAKAAKNNLSTGIKADDLETWLTLALRVKKARVTSLPFDDRVVTNRVKPDYDRIHTLVQQAIADSLNPNPTTSATPAASSTPSAGASTGASTGKKKTTKKPPVDPEVAQSLTDVC